MIKFLAQVFRGLHYVVGISAPSPGTSDRTFVFAWLGGIAFISAFFVAHGSSKQRNYRQSEPSLGCSEEVE